MNIQKRSQDIGKKPCIIVNLPQTFIDNLKAVLKNTTKKTSHSSSVSTDAFHKCPNRHSCLYALTTFLLKGDKPLFKQFNQ